MATTGTQVFSLAMDLIDERLDTGSIDPDDTVTYSVKTPGLLNILQAELLKQGDLFSTYEIACKPIENLLGYRAEFDIKAFEGTEYICSANGSAKAYYFEADRVGTVYVEDYNGAWNTLATVTTVNTPEGFTAYKGVVTPTSGATRSRLRFNGSYYYRSVNRALFSVPFSLAADIPDYRPWVRHQMPTDFKSVNEIINEEKTSYSQSAAYKWEGKRDLYIDYYYTGNIRIKYHPVPTLVTTLTDTLQLDDITARTILPYGLAAHLMLEENASTAAYFNSRFEEMKAAANKKPASPIEQITNVYGGFDG